MIIIVNEFSLNGQFESIAAFTNRINESLRLIEIITSLKIPLYPNQTFYDCNVTAEHSLHYVLMEHKSDDTLRALKNQLLKLYYPPHWQEIQKHTCKDKYSCSYTQNECNYGLAEAVENDKIVFSFPHVTFSVYQIRIRKNGELINLENIFQLQNIKDFFLKMIETKALVLHHEEKIFTYEKTNQLLLKYFDYASKIDKKSQEEKISVYEEWAQLLGVINGWEYDQKLSKKNNRSTYTRNINGTKCQLEVDTEKGCYEYYQNETHKGEYNFEGVHFSEGIATRKTNS
jgi:hypothetical protein